LYAKLAKRAAKLWVSLQEEDIRLQAENGRGPLFIRASNLLLLSSREEAEKLQKEHQREGFYHGQVLDRASVHKSYPAVEMQQSQHAFIDHDCFVLSAVDCMHSLEDKALRHGAVIHCNERVDLIDNRVSASNDGKWLLTKACTIFC
jgi:glycine/D-amino acid oxidase-like deaminating enzyme